MKITFGEKRTAVSERVIDPDEVAHGPGWIAVRRGDELELRYQTAGHGTPEGRLAIGEEELRMLGRDPAALDAILRQNGL